MDFLRYGAEAFFNGEMFEGFGFTAKQTFMMWPRHLKYPTNLVQKPMILQIRFTI